jgi:heme oxygenase
MASLTIDEEFRKNSRDDFLEFLKACPQVVQQGLGLQLFEEELEKALTKYAYFHKRLMIIEQ